MVVLRYSKEQWKAMGNLKSSIQFMTNNNEYLPEQNQGRYDRAIEKNKNLFKYFLKDVPERVETQLAA